MVKIRGNNLFGAPFVEREDKIWDRVPIKMDQA